MTNSEDECLPEGLCRAGRWLAPLALIGLLWCPAPADLPLSAWRLVAVTVAMAILWLTQGIPIAATSMLPLCAYPLLGIQKADVVSKSYIDSNIWLSLGGFIIALGIERWGLHRRLALHVLCALGGSPRTLVLGFMLATSLISMWISNTATALMMLPIGIALLTTLEELWTDIGQDGVRATRPDWLPVLGTSLTLGIAYAASIGGIMSPVGTPTNVAFLGIWERQFPDAPTIPTGQWLLAFGPLGLAMTFATWFVLTWFLPRKLSTPWLDVSFFRSRLTALGRPSRGEYWMMIIFVLTAVLWIFRAEFQFGDRPLFMGWGKWLERALQRMDWAGDFRANYLHDATVSITMCLLMFCIPVTRNATGQTAFLMDWPTANRLPWDLIVLFGGGFAMAGAFESTGLAQWIGNSLTTAIQIRSLLLWILLLCTLMTFLTEFTSNVATANIFLPVIASASISLGFDPRLLMLPATISTSLGFMLPVGTPPNAIVFGTGRIRIDQMARYGFVVNLIGIGLVSLFTMTWIVPILGIHVTQLPEWSQSPTAATR